MYSTLWKSFVIIKKCLSLANKTLMRIHWNLGQLPWKFVLFCLESYNCVSCFKFVVEGTQVGYVVLGWFCSGMVLFLDLSTHFPFYYLLLSLLSETTFWRYTILCNSESSVLTFVQNVLFLFHFIVLMLYFLVRDSCCYIYSAVCLYYLLQI